MTQHPRPPLFGASIHDGLGPPRVLSHAEQMALISSSMREAHWPPEKDRETRPKMRFFDPANFQHTMRGEPATVADITGPGIKP